MKIFLKSCLIFLLVGMSLIVIPTAEATPLDPPTESYASQPDSSVQTSSLEADLNVNSDTFRHECFSKKDVAGVEGCKNFIATNQADATVWNRLGHILYELEHYETSYVSFQRAIDLQGTYALAWANVCAALNKLGEPQQALNACDTSLQLNSDSSDSVDEKTLALNNKAIALYSLERYQDSIDTLDVALAIKPDDMHLQLNRAIILHVLAYIPSS
ncbi:MAG: tetratricopeptide repeat protein [Cyanothece sp. SIO2G6]|nr:tetratricopeptide repeat protein [Cyanothece sp. SIO2G6]